MSHCPHKDIRDCPLYLAAHDAELCGLSCMGDWGPDWCGVDKGLDYSAAVAALRVRSPRFVAITEFHAEHRATEEQRKRNLRQIPGHHA